MDIFSTFIDIAGGQTTKDRVIDGKSIKHLLLEQPPSENSSHECLFFYDGYEDVVTAVRYKQFKVHFYTVPEVSYSNFSQNCRDGLPLMDYYVPLVGGRLPLKQNLLIFNVESDPEEKFPLNLDSHQWLIDEVKILMEKHKQTILPSARILSLSNLVNSLQPCCNPPYCQCNYRIKKEL